MNTKQPRRCLLCNAENTLVSAQFNQIYSQDKSAPVLLDWLECRHCKGWFVYPLPSLEVIARHWPTVTYNDVKFEEKTANQKEHLQRRILQYLATIPGKGSLLDIGCNFGHFLEMARDDGWQAVGMEPNDEALKIAQAKGFEVLPDWSVNDSPLANRRFEAIVATDVFYYDWHPYQTLKTFQQMLSSGGILAMRLTNKHLVLNVERMIFRDSQQRNVRLSKTLKGQYHSISPRAMGKVLKEVGFTDIAFHPHATTAPWREMGKGTQASYFIADILYALTLGQFNVSPGVLLIAHKP